nr:TauD/TfdA family dioxygenase [Sphingobium nicotianae]
MVERTRGRAPHEIRRADFSSPEIDALMAAARWQLLHGTGAIILSGIDAARYDLDAHERLYWGLGTHVGTGVEQSPRRDFIAHVQREEGGPLRGYTTDMELRSHTDFHEVLSLYSLRTAPSGGESGAVSALAIHNIMARERPDLLAALYEGAHIDWPQRAVPLEEKLPFFWTIDGKTSGFNNRVFMRYGREPEKLPERLREALAFYDEIALRSDVRADFLLQPGEMFFWHNFLVLHSRQSFSDTPDRKRLLLRLWLNVPGGRPIHPAMARLTAEIDAFHGREPAVA